MEREGVAVSEAAAAHILRHGIRRRVAILIFYGVAFFWAE